MRHRLLNKLSITHSFLFAIFPVLFLFAYNIDEVPATDLLLPMLVVIALTLILLFSLRLVTKNYNKIAIITSLFLILFFSYGCANDLAYSLEIGRITLNRIFILGSLWVLIFMTGAFLVVQARRDFSTFTKFLNVTAIVLVAISLINISVYSIKTINIVQDQINEEDASLNLDNLPDIYYVILDMYTRADTLKQAYNYDNSEFIDYLTDKGFYVASKSRSNYDSTFLSIASSLNMDYLKAEEGGSGAIQLEMIGNSKVSRFLKENGYRYIFIGGGIAPKGLAKYTDAYLVYTSDSLFRKTDFARSLIETTALSPFARFFPDFFGDYDRKARLYVFDKLADIPNYYKEPKFVYAHIICPHAPYVFDRDGNPTNGEGTYIDQVIFVSKKIEAVIDEILLKSDVPPIIILQGDTGYVRGGKGHAVGVEHNILNAYYLLGKDTHVLYETITPVNSFRIVFNLYFGTDYELLKDESYFADYEHPYEFIPIPPESGAD